MRGRGTTRRQIRPMGTKSLYMSVAAVSEPHHDCRVTPGSPPLPSFPPVTTYLVSGSSCELMTFPLNGTGNIAPTLNIQGSNTTLTGPLGDDKSFSYAADKDTDGTMYVLGYWAISSGNGTQYFVSAFSANSTGNVAPLRRFIINNSVVTGYNQELQWGGLCVDGHGNVYVGVGHWIFKFPTTSSGTVNGTAFVTANPIWSGPIDPHGISSLYFDVVRQVIWATYMSDQTDTLGPVVVAYNLDGSTYAEISGTPLSNPMQVAIDPEGAVWIGDSSAAAGFQPALLVYQPPTLALSTTIFDSVWNNRAYIGVGIELNGTIHVSIGNGSQTGYGHLYSYPKGSAGNVNGTNLTDINGAATFLATMISGAVTFPAQIRLIT